MKRREWEAWEGREDEEEEGEEEERRPSASGKSQKVGEALRQCCGCRVYFAVKVGKPAKRCGLPCEWRETLAPSSFGNQPGLYGYVCECFLCPR